MTDVAQAQDSIAFFAVICHHVLVGAHAGYPIQCAQAYLRTPGSD